MKTSTKKITAIIMCIIALFALASCSDSGGEGETPKASLWDSAKYVEDTELGEGEKTLKVTVVAVEKSVVFTVHSDKDTVGEALLENGIVEGTDGQFGLYISHVNGIKAVYEEDGAYWGFLKDGEFMSTGVDMTELTDGAEYELVYTEE